MEEMKENNYQINIDLYRRRIDYVDDKILYWLSRRQLLVEKIGLVKKKYKIPPLDKKRWNEVVSNRIIKSKKLKLNIIFIRKLFEVIHEYALATESNI